MSSNNSSSSSASGGIGFCGFLAIAFIVLKLMGVIKWSWLWVLSPLWIPTAIVIVVLLIILIVHLIRKAIRRRKCRNRNKTTN